MYHGSENQKYYWAISKKYTELTVGQTHGETDKHTTVIL